VLRPISIGLVSGLAAILTANTIRPAPDVMVQFVWEPGPRLMSNDGDRAVELRIYDVRDIALTHEAADELRQLVIDVVDPDSWREVGGTVGLASEWAGRMIIAQTPENHEQILGLLRMMREAMAKGSGEE
jgi:hypothetical protein